MARLICVLFSISAILPSARAQQSDSGYVAEVSVESRRAPSDFAPDANLNKKVWKRARWIRFSHSMSGSPDYPDEATQVASVWTATSVYFVFVCKYDRLNVFPGEDAQKERWELWNRDVAEVFLNPQPDRLLHYYEFEVAPNNQWIDLEITRGEKPNHDASWNSGFTHAVRTDEKKRRWVVEMRIPLRPMGVSEIKPGTKWRGNFFRAAGQGQDAQRKFLAWSTIPEGTTFHAPSRFGIIHFVD
jgi:Carbohydrate family 9 binding domain-like